MKNRLKLTFVIMITLSTIGIVNAQISVREKTTKPTNTILVYDSLNNFGFDLFGDKVDYYKDFIDSKYNRNPGTKSEIIENARGIYQQYVGQQLYVLSKPKHGHEWGNDYSGLRGKYFSIVDIEYNVDNYNGDLTISLQSSEGKKIKWTVYSFNIDKESIIVGFYEKLKSLYVDSVFVYTGKAKGEFSKKITDNITHITMDHAGNTVFLHVGEKWTCTDFQIVDDDYIMQLYAVLHNEKGNEIIARLNNTFLFEGELNMAFFSCFEKESEFITRKKSLAERYGEDNAELISIQKVAIGMTKAMCIESWGLPDHINKTIVSDQKTEQWIYPKRSYLYFTEDVLTAIQQ